ncbi:hypothetical protein BKA64DRAFT_275759 [Cadophora sp. MPI-SDFR-AT-0126]|nr:hypothetical protein BKA64DRAFT_275759 [Leotiomycetes sp. MPI-SDFR-AT-0126]
MPLQRQTHLGRSPGGQLCLQKPQQIFSSPGGQLCLQKPQQIFSAESVGPSHISVLPDEILIKILSYVPPTTRLSGYKHVTDQGSFPLTLVCKKWGRLYEPTLFRTITAHHSGSSRLSRLRAVLGLLNSRPHLRGYPRKLCIWLHRAFAGAAICQILSAIIKCCTGLRGVSFYGTYTPETSELLSLISTLPRLEHLELGDSTLQLFFGDFTLPSLQSLVLTRYGCRNQEDSTTLYKGEAVAVPQVYLDNLLSPSRYHTGNVTSMSLREPSCLPNVTEHISDGHQL